VNLTKSNLQVRHNETTGFFVENLFIADCDVMDDCLAVLEEGIRNRHKAAHNLNEHSSRSHSIFTIYIEINDDSGYRRQGKISFVDLAGSEKASESKTTGKQLTETMNINKSLLALGNISL
jgi:kinesin family protein 12